MKKTILLLVLSLGMIINGFAQVAINETGAEADSSAILDLSSTNKGFLVPRITTAQRNAISTDQSALMVYDTDTESFWFWDNSQTSWIEIKAGSALDINSLADGSSDGSSIFLGDSAGISDNGNNNNIAIGINALKENTSGISNVAIGNAALELSVGRSNLVAIGDSAMYSNGTYGSYAVYGINNTAVGAKSMVKNIMGANNTANGTLSLYSNTEGSLNTAVGYGSLYSNTTGVKNTACGTNSLYSNTEGDYNTAYGVYSLYFNKSGVKNTAVGYYSLYNDTTGSYNVALGYGSLYNNQNGKFNTATGCRAMYLTTTAHSNVAMGVYSLYRNTDRSNLVAIGDSALYNNGINATETYHATANVAVGSKTLYSNTTGNGNVGVGSESLFYNTTGAENTALGYQAGWGNYGYGRLLSGCVYLGYQAGKYNYNNNKLFIDNSDTHYPLIGGDFDVDRVDINGTVKITGGNPGDGKVLTSDVDGDATWETPMVYASEINDLSDAIYDGTSLFLGAGAGVNDDGYNSNAAIGHYSLNANTSGIYNTATGYQSLLHNTTGSWNSAYGFESLGDNIGGEKNTAIGFNSMSSNTGGSNNVGIGYNALTYNVNGNNNTAVGFNAGLGVSENNNTGCVFLGYEAGKNNTLNNKLYIANSATSIPLIGGDFSINQVDINGTIKITGGTPGDGKVLTSDANGLATWETPATYANALNDLTDAITDGSSVFVGDQVGANDDGVNYNTAFGDEAFKTNTSGQHNTAFGYKTLENSNGESNSAFGLNALRYNTSGGYNTAIGRAAIFYNQTGSNNTAIGHGAGLGSSGSSYSGCVFLGYEAGKNNTNNNKLFIDNSSTSTPLIGGDFDTDQLYFNASKVGIGTDSPNELLEVASTAAGNRARMIVSNGDGANRKVVLFVSPSTSYNYARIDAYDYGGSTGVTLKINTVGDGNIVSGGSIIPESHITKDLGANGTAWNNVYAHNYVTQGSAAFSNINVTSQIINFPPKEKNEGAFDEYTEKGLKELDPASLPVELTEGDALLIDEITTYNYKANYEQQQQIEQLKKENVALKQRLEKLEKLLLNN